MTAWEKWIKKYAKRNYSNVLRTVLDSIHGIPRFDLVTRRAQNALWDAKRFYLKNDEKLDLLSAWKGIPMELNRALALAWSCNCSLRCFNWYTCGKEIDPALTLAWSCNCSLNYFNSHTYEKELILTYDGYYVKRGCFYVFISDKQVKEVGMLNDLMLKSYLEKIKGYKEDELWILR